MLVRAWIEEGDAAGGHAAHETELLEEIHGRVDRGQRETGEAGRGGAHHLLGAGMSIQLAQRSVEDESLRGHALAALAQRGGKSGLGGGGSGAGLRHP
jgi:hypothetical protein